MPVWSVLRSSASSSGSTIMPPSTTDSTRSSAVVRRLRGAEVEPLAPPPPAAADAAATSVTPAGPCPVLRQQADHLVEHVRRHHRAADARVELFACRAPFRFDLGRDGNDAHAPAAHRAHRLVGLDAAAR